jgi:hypothetical protein
LRYAVLNFLAFVIAFVSLISAAAGEGRFLDGCLALKGNEQMFSRTDAEWLGDRRGETMIVYALINVEDKATVCGMYLNKGVVPTDDLKRLLSKSELKSGRQTLVRNLSFFKNICTAGACVACAPCYKTSLDWKSSYGRTKPKFVPGEGATPGWVRTR